MAILLNNSTCVMWDSQAQTGSLHGRRALLAAAALAGLVCTGCQSIGRIDTPDRQKYGLILILPGIEGTSPLNQNIARGLHDGGVSSAIEIHDWTTGIPGNFLINLANLERNREEAWKLARRIVRYQQRWPNRPVFLIGHSGGGGIAVLALENLPERNKVDWAILLAPALSADYDLSKALRRSRHGIMNLYSDKDVGLLKVGTTIFGPIDREFGISAGAAGFQEPADLSETERLLYQRYLRQVRWREHMKRYGADGSHFGWASRRFAREYLAPLIIERETSRSITAFGR